MGDTPTTTGPALILKNTGQIFPLTKEPVSLGRKPDNTIVLSADDLKASRHHANIFYENGRYMLQDMGSVNGTFVNNQRLTGPHALADGDVIGIGAATVAVHLPLADTQPRLRPPASPIVAAEAAPAKLADTLIRAVSAAPLNNPYVGPRTFAREESDRFFGRELEARELLSLVISERLVLFYAQSGAGKSSLVNTRLIPQLQAEGYAVLPVSRVSGELPAGIADVANIYMFNLQLSMDESDSHPRYFTHMRLTEFLAGLTSLDGVHYFYDHDLAGSPEVADDDLQPAPYVLLIDQFEEIVTTHPSRWQDREDFFRQLAEAMAADPYLWVVLSLREDYVAALDPYAHLLPGNLRARFYMQRMGYDAALEAVKKPAEKFGRSFAPGVAESLADNLRQIRVQDAATAKMVATRLGQFIEPVQLQVVCYQLWQNLSQRPAGMITPQDLQELGDVDQALAQFYEQALTEVILKTGTSEIDLRNWFESQLVTESGTKGTVYRGPTATGGINNRAVDILVQKFLVRVEVRAGGTWYELIHDRLIEPILKSNQSWRQEQPLIQMARMWADSGKSEASLLEGQQLKEQLATNWRGLGPLVREFLEASQFAQKTREEQTAQEELRRAQELAEERQNRLDDQVKAAARLRSRALWITLFGILALLMGFAAGGFGYVAQERASAAIAARRTAEAALDQAVAAQHTAEAARGQAVVARSNAVGAQGTAIAESTVSAAAKATAEAGSAAAAANAAEARRLLEIQQATQTAEAALNLQEQAQVEQTRVALEATVTVQAATLTAPTPTATPTHTPLPPTKTPTGVYTPPPTATATATPPATATPTPDLTATANVEMLQALSQEVTAGCKINPGAELKRAWNKYETRLGCPTGEMVGGEFAEQSFENGYMTWSGIYQEIYAIVGDTSGRWRWFDQKTTDSYGPSDTGSCSANPPAGLYQPVRGFGAVWCANPDLRRDIGYARNQEYGISTNLIQKFENGVIIRDSQKRVFVLFAADSTFARED